MDMGLFLELFHAARYAYIRIRQRNGRALCSEGNTRWRERVASGRAILVGTRGVTIHIDTPVHAPLAVWSGEYEIRKGFLRQL